MSGGHWEYSGYKIQDALEAIAEDKEVQSRFPRLAKTLDKLAYVLYNIEHDLDWDISCDSEIKRDDKWERGVLREIRDSGDLG